MIPAPSVDVLIVSYNSCRDLRNTLDSLLAHLPGHGVEVRVKVLDNGSTDGSPEMVEADFGQVELIRSESNLGFGKANNALAAQSDADYLLLLNSDVIVERDIITRLVDVMSGDERIVAAGPRLVFPDGQVQYSAHRFPTLGFEFARVLRGKRLGRVLSPIFDSETLVAATFEMADTEAAIEREPEFMWATCWLVRRLDPSGQPLFDESFPIYDEDLDFCRRARAAGGRLRYVPDVELVHIGGASSSSTAAKQQLERRARRLYYLRHHGQLSASVYSRLLPLVERLTLALQTVPTRGLRRMLGLVNPEVAGLADSDVLAVGASRGGVGDLFEQVVLRLDGRGHRVARVPVAADGRVPGWSGVRAALRARRAIRSAPVVHVEFGSNDLEVFWFAVAAVLMRRDVVVVAHDYPKLAHHPGAVLLGRRARVMRLLAYRVVSPLLDERVKRAMLRRAGVVVVFGPEARDGFEARGARIVLEIALGFDPPGGEAGPPSAGEYILFAGFLGPSKGVEELLDAWELASREISFPLLLAGEPDEPWFSELLAGREPFTRAPEVLGAVAEEARFQELFERAAIVALPYRSSSPASGILVRAMVAGRAIVATPVPAARVLVDGENGRLVPIGDPRALGEALIELAASPAERDRLGAAAAATAREAFSWERHLSGLEAAYAAAARSR